MREKCHAVWEQYLGYNHRAALQLECTEKRMLRGISGKSLREKMPTVELREHMTAKSILDVPKRGQLRWYGHVLQKD